MPIRGLGDRQVGGLALDDVAPQEVDLVEGIVRKGGVQPYKVVDFLLRRPMGLATPLVLLGSQIACLCSLIVIPFIGSNPCNKLFLYNLAVLQHERNHPNLFTTVLTHIVALPTIIGSFLYQGTLAPIKQQFYKYVNQLAQSEMQKDSPGQSYFSFIDEYGEVNDEIGFNEERQQFSLFGTAYEFVSENKLQGRQVYRYESNTETRECVVDLQTGTVAYQCRFKLYDPGNDIQYDVLKKKMEVLSCDPPSDAVLEMSWSSVEGILTGSSRCNSADKEKVLKFITKIKNRKPWLRVPRDDPAKSVWFNEQEKFLKGIANKLGATRFDKDDATPKEIVEELAKAASFCGPRYHTILTQSWGMLNRSSPSGLEDSVVKVIQDFGIGITEDDRALADPLRGQVHMPLQMKFAVSDLLYLGPVFDELGGGLEHQKKYQGLRKKFFKKFTREKIVERVVKALNNDEIDRSHFGDWLTENVEVPADWFPMVFDGKKDNEAVSFLGLDYTREELREEYKDNANLQRSYFCDEKVFGGESRANFNYRAEHVEKYLIACEVLRPKL